MIGINFNCKLRALPARRDFLGGGGGGSEELHNSDQRSRGSANKAASWGPPATAVLSPHPLPLPLPADNRKTQQRQLIVGRKWALRKMTTPAFDNQPIVISIGVDVAPCFCGNTLVLPRYYVWDCSNDLVAVVTAAEANCVFTADKITKMYPAHHYNTV